MNKLRDFFRSWGPFIAFLLLLMIVTERAIHRVHTERELLQQKLSALQAEKRQTDKRQEALKLQIKSQSDPEFVEMVLKKELGLTPEGQKKIFFSN